MLAASQQVWLGMEMAGMAGQLAWLGITFMVSQKAFEHLLVYRRKFHRIEVCPLMVISRIRSRQVCLC